MSDVLDDLNAGADPNGAAAGQWDSLSTPPPAEFDDATKAWVKDYCGFDIFAATGMVLSAMLAQHKFTIPGFSGMALEQKRAMIFQLLVEKLKKQGQTAPAAAPATKNEASAALAKGEVPVSVAEPAAAPPKPPKTTKKAAAKAAAASAPPPAPSAPPSGEPGLAQAPQPDEAAAPAAAAAPAPPKQKVKIGGKGGDGDMILTIAHKIENMDETQAKHYVGTLSDQRAVNEFELGGVLQTIISHGWFAPYKSFQDWCKEASPISYRKARYLAVIYSNLIDSGVTWSQVEVLGWSKLRLLAKYVTQANVAELVKWAQPLSVMQIEENAEAKWGATSSDDTKTEPTVKPITTKTFKFHEDQLTVVESALGKAMQEKSTSFPAVAFEHICLGYLGEHGEVGSSSGAVQKDLKDVMKEAGFQKVLEIFGECFPEVELEASY